MLTVICGGMFAEKSTELQRRGKRLQRAGKKVGYFKPELDNRYSKDAIVTHDGAKVEAINVPEYLPHYFVQKSLTDKYDVFLIDEIQFFKSGIVPAIDLLLKLGKTVIIAGLDMDSEAKPFAVTASLMAVAEEVVKLQAVCSECGDDSWVTYNADKTDRIELGAEAYKPMCRYCYQYNKQGDK